MRVHVYYNKVVMKFIKKKQANFSGVDFANGALMGMNGALALNWALDPEREEYDKWGFPKSWSLGRKKKEKGKFIRKLNEEAIKDFDKDYQTNWTKSGLIPMFDRGDNDFVVFNPVEKTYELKNVVNDISFKKSKDLADML